MNSHPTFLRRLLALIISFLLLAVTVPSAEAGRKIDPNTKKIGLWLKENSELTSMNSVIYGRIKVGTVENSLDWKICKTITDAICTAANQIMVIHFLPICKDNSLNCLNETWAIDSSGKKIEGKFLKKVPESGNTDFPAVEEINLSEGIGAGAVYQFPDVIHAGGTDKYLVVLRNQFWINKSEGESALKYKYSVGGFRSGIIPVTEVNGNYRRATVTDGFGSDSNLDCQATDTGICLKSHDFPEGYQFGIDVKFSQKLSGWFHGRIHSPVIKTTSIAGGEQVSIQAKPVRVAALDYVADISEYSQEAKDYIFQDQEFGVAGTPDGWKIVDSLSGDISPVLLKLFSPVYKDKATSNNEYWSINSLNGSGMGDVQRCSDNSGDLAGIVTTNSLVYSAGPPAFSKETDSLDYKLASPHFEASGAVATGTYDLLIRGDVARCIYGFTGAPIKASISILSADGAPKVATTVMGERDGWLYVDAAGFDYSSPVVKVSLSQDAPVLVPAKKSAVKKYTLVCKRGTVKKKVTSTKAKCPNGYTLVSKSTI